MNLSPCSELARLNEEKVSSDEIQKHLNACQMCRVSGHSAFDPRTLPDPANRVVPRPFASDPTIILELNFLRPAGSAAMGQIGNYDILNLAGVGGMAVVMEALDRKLNRKVAIKFLMEKFSKDADFRRRFVREAKEAVRLEHDRIIVVHDVQEAGKDGGLLGDGNAAEGRPFIVMEFIEKSLQQLIDESGKLPMHEVIRLGIEICEGLAFAHDKGCLHRDIKPANLLLKEKDGRFHIKIADFGLAAPESENRITQFGTIVGTPAYMAPEQFAPRGEPDKRSDLYSLGCVLYAMCTGRPPFESHPPETVIQLAMRVEKEKPAPVESVNPEVPAFLVRIIHKLLEKDPSKRFQSAAEVTEALRYSPSPGDPPIPRRFSRGCAITLSVSAVAATLLFLVAGLSPFGGSHAKHQIYATQALQYYAQAQDATDEQSEKELWKKALVPADKCIDEYQPAAEIIQSKLESERASPPPSGSAFTAAERQATLDNGPLNDVSACLFVRGRALEKLNDKDAAMESYEAAAKLTYGRCYDPNGWFWSPAENAKSRLEKLRNKPLVEMSPSKEP